MDAEQKATVKTIAEARKLLTAALEKLDAVEQRVVAAPSDRQVIKKVMTAFDELRARRYDGEKYLFNGAADAAQTKRLLKSMSREEIWKRMQVYIASNDPFFMKVRHSYGVFVKSINALGAGLLVGPGPAMHLHAVRGCSHTPVCVTDAEHTRRRTQDMRS